MDEVRAAGRAGLRGIQVFTLGQARHGGVPSFGSWCTLKGALDCLPCCGATGGAQSRRSGRLRNRGEAPARHTRAAATTSHVKKRVGTAGGQHTDAANAGRSRRTRQQGKAPDIASRSASMFPEQGGRPSPPRDPIPPRLANGRISSISTPLRTAVAQTPSQPWRSSRSSATEASAAPVLRWRGRPAGVFGPLADEVATSQARASRRSCPSGRRRRRSR